jgi:phage host-nuclease inhibitor protein Gam
MLRLREAEMNSKKNDAFERYEDKIAMMSMEIERLNGLNSGRARETA